MTYYKTWQDALMAFIEQYGHNYADSYNLAAEFEQHLGRNVRGVWYLRGRK